MTKRKRFDPLVREQLLKKNGGKCCYCNCDINKNNGAVEHIFPIYLGGKDDIDNLVPVCKSCNSAKGKMTAPEFMAYMLDKLVRDKKWRLFKRALSGRVTASDIGRFGGLMTKEKHGRSHFQNISKRV